MSYKNPGPRPSVQTWYALFPFGTFLHIGLDQLNMANRWVEAKAYTRQQASEAIRNRFPNVSFHLHSEEAFTDDRRKFFPQGCALVLFFRD